MALIELGITGLAVVDEAALEFDSGFVTLTGETGSGKSVCITALRLVLGGRVEGDPIRAGCERAVLRAVFDEVPAALGDRLAALGIPVDDDYLTMHRELIRGGRGQCRVNGALVSAAVLREFGEQLVELTGQGESHRLLRAGRQRALLDSSGGRALAEARARATGAVTAWGTAEKAVERARQSARFREEEVNTARSVIAELDGLELREEEAAALAAERDRLRHLADLVLAADRFGDACHGADDTPGTADVLAAAVVAARPLEGIDPDLDALLGEAEALVDQVRDLGRQGRRVASDLVVDELRLSAVEERLDILERVRRRHGGSLMTAIATLAAAKQTLDDEIGEAGLQALDNQAAAAARAAAAAVESLSRLRSEAATVLEMAVRDRLCRLGLPRARFRVVVRQVETDDGLEVTGRRLACTADGIDEVEFRLAANRDGIPLPLDQGPSGGELSRLALALRAVVADSDDCPTLVLDEIDSGVGGETAARVGEMLASIAETRQVVAVTHRAEIACRAGHHLLVRKRDHRSGVTTAVSVVEGGERLTEIARLLSGRDTAAALARAEELLVEGRPDPVLAPRTIAPQ